MHETISTFMILSLIVLFFDEHQKWIGSFKEEENKIIINKSLQKTFVSSQGSKLCLFVCFVKKVNLVYYIFVNVLILGAVWSRSTFFVFFYVSIKIKSRGEKKIKLGL